ncbi:zinc finger SWIM domain-containing protein 6-like [Pantherophis guttatus]|uniref:Shadow of prion protein n=1 Tax=Pantherophis guttatus TaxID=94885 RepID=A0ABM3Z259_PANGU|nr:zinc finger SWIM domain-containing protein 6-like [Pantherophis guttatus]
MPRGGSRPRRASASRETPILAGGRGGQRCLPGVRPCPPPTGGGVGAREARSDEEPEPRRRAERGAVGAAAASGAPDGWTGAAQRQAKPGATESERGWAHFLETMRVKCSPAMCWTLLFLLAIFMEGIVCKGGRGGARGSARGTARGTSRRSKSAPRYRSSGTALRVAAAAAAGGAAAAAAAAGMRMGGPDSPQYGEMQPSNNTAGSTHHPGPWPLLYVSASLWCVALVPRAF